MTLRWRHNERDSVSNHQPHDCILNRLFRRRSKKSSKLQVTGLCVGNSPGTGEFPAQMASYAENVSIWWRHHELVRLKNDLKLCCLSTTLVNSCEPAPSKFIIFLWEGHFLGAIESIWCRISPQNYLKRYYKPWVHQPLIWRLKSSLSVLGSHQKPIDCLRVPGIASFDILLSANYLYNAAVTQMAQCHDKTGR